MSIDKKDSIFIRFVNFIIYCKKEKIIFQKRTELQIINFLNVL